MVKSDGYCAAIGRRVTDTTCSEGACIVEASKATAELLKRSFILVKNEKRLQVRNIYALPKVAVMKASTLDQVMGSQCSMSTKSNDWSLSHVQALMLDALAPLMEVMEQFNSDAEEVSSEVITKAVENAIELLGNASSQMSSLRRTQVLQEYNKKLVAWTQHRRASSLRLFGQNFPRDITEYLDQVASPRRWPTHHLRVFTSLTPTGH